MNRSFIASCTLVASLFLAGCQSNKPSSCAAPKSPATVAPATASATPVVIAPVAAAAIPPAVEKVAIRIKAGMSAPVTDSTGLVWLAEQGFEGGDVIERAGIDIANTKQPEIYRAEHYAMESFWYKIPNGKYEVKLHFAETFEGITAAGERVFSFNVEGQEFKDFDIWKKAGGSQRAYVETVNVDITDGKLDIKFTSNIENPAINGIEIIPVL